MKRLWKGKQNGGKGGSLEKKHSFISNFKRRFLWFKENYIIWSKLNVFSKNKGSKRWYMVGLNFYQTFGYCSGKPTKSGGIVSYGWCTLI